MEQLGYSVPEHMIIVRAGALGLAAPLQQGRRGPSRHRDIVPLAPENHADVGPLKLSLKKLICAGFLYKNVRHAKFNICTIEAFYPAGHLAVSPLRRNSPTSEFAHLNT